MTDPTSPTTPDAAAPDALATWRVVLSCGDVGTCVPRDCEDGSWSAVVRWPDGAISRADGSDAGQSVYRAAVERCEWLYGRADDAAYVAEVLPPGVPSRAELTATLARLRAPADLAAIEARAAAATPCAPEDRAWAPHVAKWREAGTLALYVDELASAVVMQEAEVEIAHADVTTLLALLAAAEERHAAEVAGARAAALREAMEVAARLCDARAEALDASVTDDEADEDEDGYGRFCEAMELAAAIRRNSAAVAALGAKGGAE